MILKLSDFLKHGEPEAPAIRRAVESLNDGDTLMLGGGVHHIFAEGAEVRNYYISNNDPGDKPIIFPLVGKKNITIDGEGAQLVFHDSIVGFVCDHSENITIKNLSTDYSSARYAQAEIIEADRYKTVLKFSGEFACRVDEEGHFCFYHEKDGWERHVMAALALEFEKMPWSPRPIPSSTKGAYFPYTGPKRDHGFLRSMYKDVMLEQKSDDTIIIHGTLGFEHTVGNYLVMTHWSREFPTFIITEAKDTKLENTHIRYAMGMGVIGQLSENITLDHVVTEPQEGSARLLSVNADSTHFVNCRGKIEMANCKFVSMNDDATNIHGIYALYQKREGDNTAVCGYGHSQQKGINICRPGDRVAILDLNTTSTAATRTVVNSYLRIPDELVVEFDAPIPEPGERFVIDNLSTAPEVYLHDCESGFNRPRGFLLSSGGRMLVERCKFYNMYQGINIGCELRDWYESCAVNDITIRDCDFDNSAYAGGVAIVARPKLYEENPRNFFFGRIVVENNRFKQSGKRMLSVDLAEKLVFKGNEFILEEGYPKKGQTGETGASITNCGKIELDSND